MAWRIALLLTALATVAMGYAGLRWLAPPPALPVQAVLVTMVWPGATAEAVEAQIVTPIEGQLMARLTVREMFSAANSSGIGRIEVLLPASTPAHAVAQVRGAVDGMAASLPAGAGPPSVEQGRIRPLAAHDPAAGP